MTLPAEIDAALVAREPLLHHPELGTAREHYLAQTAGEFWDVGASGSVYDRDEVIDALVQRDRRAGEERWRIILGSECGAWATDEPVDTASRSCERDHASARSVPVPATTGLRLKAPVMAEALRARGARYGVFGPEELFELEAEHRAAGISIVERRAPHVSHRAAPSREQKASAGTSDAPKQPEAGRNEP